VTHNASRMASMENPAQGLREVIRRIDDTWDVAHDNVASLLPILNGKVLDINVMRTLSRNTSINHLDSRHVVFVDRSWFILRETQFSHYSTEVLGLLSGKDGSEKLSFRRASGSDRLVVSTPPVSRPIVDGGHGVIFGAVSRSNSYPVAQHMLWETVHYYSNGLRVKRERSYSPDCRLTHSTTIPPPRPRSDRTAHPTTTSSSSSAPVSALFRRGVAEHRLLLCAVGHPQ